MRLQFWGYELSPLLLETANTRIMVECGMYQGRKEIRSVIPEF